MAQVWLVTGANRGLGRAVAEAAAAAGHTVVATARDVAELAAWQAIEPARRLAVQMDVTSGASIEGAVGSALRAFGQIDVLVNNAGYGQLGAFEEIGVEQVAAQFQTNVFGLMNVTRAVLPAMRQQRSGRIFNIASMAGYKGGDRYSVYAASKFAVAGFSESLAAEVAEFGIFVTVVAPGFFRTDFLDASSVSHPGGHVADYTEGSARKRATLENLNRQQAGDPRLLGAALVQLAAAPAPPVHFLVGADAVHAVRERNEILLAEIGRFEALSIATAFRT